MGAVCADGKIELEKKFVGDHVFCVIRAPVLSTDLAELAGPVRQEDRSALVDERAIEAAAGSIATRTDVPTAAELVFAERVESERLLFDAVRNLLMAPDEFGA